MPGGSWWPASRRWSLTGVPEPLRRSGRGDRRQVASVFAELGSYILPSRPVRGPGDRGRGRLAGDGGLLPVLWHRCTRGLCRFMVREVIGWGANELRHLDTLERRGGAGGRRDRVAADTAVVSGGGGRATTPAAMCRSMNTCAPALRMCSPRVTSPAGSCLCRRLCRTAISRPPTRCRAAGHPHRPVSPIGSFTDPEYAQVGLTEARARQDREVVVAMAPFAVAARPIIDGRPDGFCKVIVDRASHRIVGCHVVGERAVELAQVAAVAIAAAMTVEQFAGSRSPSPPTPTSWVEPCSTPPASSTCPASGTYPTSQPPVHDLPCARAPSDPTPAGMWGQPADPGLGTGHHPRAARRSGRTRAAVRCAHQSGRSPNSARSGGPTLGGSAAAAGAVHRLRVGGASVQRCRALGTGAARQATLRLDGGARPAMVSAAESRASDTRHGVTTRPVLHPRLRIRVGFPARTLI